MAQPGLKFLDGILLEGGLQPTIQDETPIDTSGSQQICQSSQEQLLEGGIAVPDHQASARKGHGSVFSSLFQLVVPGSQTKQQMVPHLRSEQAKPIPPIENLQNGNAKNDQALPSARGVDHIRKFQ